MATVTTAAAFTGFPRDGIQFLVDLAANNNREWFVPRKAEYEALLKRPLEALCVALDRCFRVRSIPLRADPRTSPFRIHRDVRFSPDKSPYRTTIAASFTSSSDPDSLGRRHAYAGIGGHLSVGPDGVRVGGGRWQPDPATLAAWRRLVIDRNAELHEALDAPAFVATFGRLEGERFKRVPAGAPADHPDADLLKLRQLLFTRLLPEEDALSPALPDRVAETFADGLPVLHLLAALPAEDSART